jgi:hypothetical protein
MTLKEKNRREKKFLDSLFRGIFSSVNLELEVSGTSPD